MNKLNRFSMTAVIAIAAIGTANGQSVAQRVAQIRDACTEVNRQIDAGVKDKTSGFHNAVWSVGGKGDGRQWPAVGSMETRDEMWFEGEGGAGGGEEDDTVVIRKIVSTYKGAADLHSRTEVCYGEAGEPMFIYSNSDLDSADGKMVETRLYFDKSKLIRLIRGGRTTDAKFTPKELEDAAAELENANDRQKMFARLFL